MKKLFIPFMLFILFILLAYNSFAQGGRHYVLYDGTNMCTTSTNNGVYSTNPVVAPNALSATVAGTASNLVLYYLNVTNQTYISGISNKIYFVGIYNGITNVTTNTLYGN